MVIKNTLVKPIFIWFNFLIISILVIFSIFTWNDSIMIKNWSEIITFLSITLMIYNIYVLYKKNDFYSDFKLWFILLSNLFMFGRVYLRAFGKDSNIFWDLLSRYPSEVLYHTGLFLICAIQSIFIGFVLSDFIIKKKNSLRNTLRPMSRLNSKVFNVGLILTIISVPSRLFIDLTNIKNAQTSSSYLGISSHTGIADDIAMLFIPGIIYIIASGKLNYKKTKKIFILVLVYFIIVMLLTGDRRYQMTAIISVMLAYMNTNRVKLGFKRIFAYSMSSILVLNLLTIIRNTRRSNLVTLLDFMKLYSKDLFSFNPLYETLSEFGLSFISVVGIFNNVPLNINFQYGLSFFGAIPSLLPIGWLFGDFFRRVSFSNLISRLEQYPVGATIFGDFYANFGWLSLLFIIGFGYFLGKIFNSKMINENSYFRANYFALFYVLINLPRSSFFEIFRPAMMIYLIPIIIIKLIKK